MPHFAEENTDPASLPAGARARVLLAAGAGIAVGASFAAAQAGTAAAYVDTSPFGVTAHTRSSHHSAARHHSAPVPSPEFLVPGDRGAAVKQVQRAVHRYPTGYFGSGTRRAVTRFQHRRHLTADGVVGPQTRHALHLRVKIIKPPAPAPARAAAPAPAPAAAAPSTSSSPTHPAVTQNTSGGGYVIPSSVVQCESGGNANAVSPFSGGGLYGILDSSWQAFGGTKYAPHPYDATPAEQGQIAGAIFASQGPGAWQCWK